MNLFELFKSERTAIMEGIDHPEDLIISQGSAGADRVLKDLASLQKDPSTVSVKWDGFPAVVFGRDKAGNLVFMDKHMYDKVVNGKMDFMSIKDYDSSRDANRANLWEKESVLRPALDKIIPNVRDQYWMGDLMWTGTPPTEDGYFVFKPNTVEYRVAIDATPGRGNTLSDQIARSIGGIAVHTFIPGLGQADQPLVGLKGLRENEGVVFLVGEMKDKPKVAIDTDLLSQTQAVVNQHKKAVDKFIADLTAMKGKTVISAMGPFITRMLEEEDISGDIVPRFLEFLKERLTPAAAQKMLGENNEGWLYQEDGGGPGLLGIWTMWAAITELKNHIKQQIDTHQQGSEIIAITDGVNAHEGYVFGAGKDKLKLIDRLGFSRANFAKHRVSPEEIEQKSKMPMAAFCFGRMNPPTLGHGLVIDKTLEVGGDKAFIFLSNSTGTDDPIDPTTKAAFIEQIYPQAKGHIVTDYVQGPIYAANWLYNKGYRNMTFVAGSDRLGKEKGSIEKLLSGWNSGPIRSTDPAGAREHVVINFVSSGQRDPDAEGVTGYSGTKARQAAASGNEQQFQQYTGVGPDVVVNGKTLYQATREGMGIADAKPTTQPAPVKQQAQPQPKVQATKKVPGKAPVKKEMDTMNENPNYTPLRDKDDLKAKRKALQDIQLDPSTHKDPQLAAELARRKAALEKEAGGMKLAESIISTLGVMEDHKTSRLWMMINDYEQRAKATKNNIRRDYWLRMAQELRDQLPSNDLEEDNDPCWKDYKQVGMKKKNGKQVPNCVPKESVEEGEVIQFPKKHKSDLDSFDECPKCGRDLMGGTYMGHRVKVCNPCKQVYLPPNTGIDKNGNKVDEADKHSIIGKFKRGEELYGKVKSSFKDIGDAQKRGDSEAASKAFKKHEKYANLRAPGTFKKVDEIAGAFPSPSTREKWAKDAAASNAAEAKRQAAISAKADAERLQKNTELVDKEQKVNHHSLDGEAVPPKNEARANTKAVRTGLAKREKRADPTMDAKKQSEQDAAWERLQAYMNKPENMDVLKRLSTKESAGISADKETQFHAKLDKLVHSTFGKRDDEMEEGWKDKIGAAALVAAPIIGSIGANMAAPNTTIQGHQAQLATSSSIPDNAKLVTDDKGNKVYVWVVKGSNPKSAGQHTHLIYRPADSKVNEAPIEMDPTNPNDPMVMPPGLNPGKLSYRKSRAAAQLADLARMAAQANEKDSPAMWDAIVKHFPELETNIRSIQHGMQELEKVRRKGGVKSRGINPV